MRQHADLYGGRWAWAEALPVPALIFRRSDRRIVFANRLLDRLLGTGNGHFEGADISSVVPGIAVPDKTALRGQMTGERPADVAPVTLVTASGHPEKLAAHTGVADPGAEFVLVSLLPRAAGQSDAEHTALREQLDADTLERDVLASIGRITSSPIDFSRALADIASEFSRILPTSRISVHEFNSRSRALCLGHEWPESVPGAGADDDPEAAMARERAIEEQRPVAMQSAAGACAVIAPLLLGNRALGTLTLHVPDRQRLTDRSIALAGRLADQVAGAVHTTRTYQDKQRETELRRTLAAVGLAASQDLEITRVLERVANEIAELVRYDFMAVAIADLDRSRLRVRYQVGAEVQLPAYAAVAPEGEALQLQPAARVIDLATGVSGFEELAEAGFRSLLEVSLGSHESSVTGYMALVSRDLRSFSQLDLELMRHLAAQVTPAMQNALAHEQSVALAEARTAEAKAEARSLELERINDAKSRFLGVVSHELRTPLTSIIAYADILRKNTNGNLTERQLSHANMIRQSAAHLKFLISDLLDVSRIESGQLSLEIARFDLRSLINEVADRLRPVLAQKDQRLEPHMARGRLELEADRRRIEQVVSNIVENASKYSPAGTVITLDVHRRRDEILISVTDHGIGISAEDQQQLFTPFFRANSGLTRTEPGTGLGLSLVKKITELHGGTVSVMSKPGEGSTFTVALGAA